ncbi:MAG: N-acetylmuramoyl-L-alanine amidase, partial [Clostridia bacterium]|nr:N-acetylmuramoyl-L-alanine amidase [Clostridia bacterium]
YNSMPSALLETGYYTNPGDCQLLKDEQWRDALMKNVAKTIIEVIEDEYEER